MSQETNSPMPRRPASTVGIIVFTILGVSALICIGTCGILAWMFDSAGNALRGSGLALLANTFVLADDVVIDELGEPMTTEREVGIERGTMMIVDYTVKGPKGRGTVHAEFDNSDPHRMGRSTPTVLKVTLPSGKVVHPSTEFKFKRQRMDDTSVGRNDADGVTD